MSTPQRFHRLRAVLDRRQPDLTVLLENVLVPRNLAAVVRSLDAVGGLEAHAVWPEGKLPISRPASGGNRKWLPVRKHHTLAEALERLKARGFRILTADPVATATDFRRVDYLRPTAFLLGNEDGGVTVEARSGADELVAIPMAGMGTSLNVSVAAAVLLVSWAVRAGGIVGSLAITPAQQIAFSRRFGAVRAHRLGELADLLGNLLVLGSIRRLGGVAGPDGPGLTPHDQATLAHHAQRVVGARLFERAAGNIPQAHGQVVAGAAGGGQVEGGPGHPDPRARARVGPGRRRSWSLLGLLSVATGLPESRCWSSPA